MSQFAEWIILRVVMKVETCCSTHAADNNHLVNNNITYSGYV